MDLTELTIGRRIATVRTAKGMTQEQLGEKADVAKGYMSEIESDKKNIGTVILTRICEALDCSPNLLLTGKE